MTRQGLNCTLSYTRGTSTSQYQVRAGTVSHGVEMIYTESEARTYRAFYPHRTAEARFSVEVLLKNWDERRDFVNWLTTYAQYAIDPDTAQAQFPWMTVVIPARNFTKQGVPLQGYEWGAHTGMMAFNPQVVFEAASSPGQKAGQPAVSSVINKWSAFAQDPAIQYFYPVGTQLSGSQQPAVNASSLQYPGNPAQFANPPAPVIPPLVPGGSPVPPPLPGGILEQG